MVIGIDGYRNGWCCCTFDEVAKIELFPSISKIIKSYSSIESIFIDIPIGLSSRKIHRSIDSKIRENLPIKNKSSVFTPPCRKALEAQSYQEGNQLNKKITGKGISIQSWNIGPKIKEVDTFLLVEKKAQKFIHESHPELCFLSFNNFNPILFNKKTIEGYELRLKIIKNHIPNADQLIYDTIDKNPSTVKKDDILDAMILAISATKWKLNGSRVINQIEPEDELNIPFAIYY
jgi:predicted RNase H-like nuclease